MTRAGRKDTRWNTAVHEAGHVVVGGKLGMRGLGASVRTDGRGRTRGRTTDCRFGGSALDEAVYILAAAAAGRLITGDEALCGSSDLDDAQKALAGTGHSMADAERLAGRLVRRHRKHIEGAARRLYDKGRI